MSNKVHMIHLSDLHFGNNAGTLKPDDIGGILSGLLEGVAGSKYIVISGDITFQGVAEGYKECLTPIKEAMKQLGIPFKNLIACPGNHDIDKKTSNFNDFDAWSSELRNDKRLTFVGESARWLEFDDAVFLVVNTAFHLDYKFGCVDLGEVKVAIDEMNKSSTIGGKRRVAVAHHHFIPVLNDDTSTVRNAYAFLELLESNDFSLLMHGHQHAMLDMKVGRKQMKIFGVGSFGFHTPGVINSFASLVFEEGAEPTIKRFGLSSDVHRKIVELNLNWSI
jgi:predicted MPP superfamily phosphohydrolase